MLAGNSHPVKINFSKGNYSGNYPTVRDTEITTFEETLDNLLQRRRALARDMLCATSDLNCADFETILKGA